MSKGGNVEMVMREIVSCACWQCSQFTALSPESTSGVIKHRRQCSKSNSEGIFKVFAFFWDLPTACEVSGKDIVVNGSKTIEGVCRHLLQCLRERKVPLQMNFTKFALLGGVSDAN